MESWYFIEFCCREKEMDILKQIETNKISGKIKKRDSRKFHNPVIKPFLFLFNSIFNFRGK